MNLDFTEKQHGRAIKVPKRALIENLKLRRSRFMSGDMTGFDSMLREDAKTICRPCEEWINDSTDVEDLFPLEFLDRAVDVRCLAFVLDDGSLSYGAARPLECR